MRRNVGQTQSKILILVLDYDLYVTTVTSCIKFMHNCINTAPGAAMNQSLFYDILARHFFLLQLVTEGPSGPRPI